MSAGSIDIEPADVARVENALEAVAHQVKALDPSVLPIGSSGLNFSPSVGAALNEACGYLSQKSVECARFLHQTSEDMSEALKLYEDADMRSHESFHRLQLLFERVAYALLG
ncbi:hypothetical protein R6G85_03235 [Actinotignum urinale]|uniref:hypothetical protein n=1 Tax=Actinotignum urinale TaxID=190146 RepID=UPI002A82B142|nr:hypothetical protein [Actinotignum urinale]MDY5151503.1 hypothetical protein [Actinotignum urinale]